VLTGGHAIAGPGYFIEPTVLTGVTPEARVFTDEIFGPVAPIITFTDEDEAVRLANSTQYGLASYVYTQSISRALRIGERLDYGLLGLNAGVISNAAAPFGGVKQSGLGREGGAEGINEYTATQYVGFPDPWQE
jgi:succinate-semialdehyde dehydrogenase/glutarate-semialdehyde dehydrogenase